VKTGRLVLPGCPRQITQRGNNRQDVFLLDDDRHFYLQTLAELCRREQVRLLGQVAEAFAQPVGR
jgi:REP element-mobilizing transposase RayT